VLLSKWTVIFANTGCFKLSVFAPVNILFGSVSASNNPFNLSVAHRRYIAGTPFEQGPDRFVMLKSQPFEFHGYQKTGRVSAQNKIAFYDSVTEITAIHGLMASPGIPITSVINDDALKPLAIMSFSFTIFQSIYLAKILF
jgi:hypothetical protein